MHACQIIEQCNSVSVYTSTLYSPVGIIVALHGYVLASSPGPVYIKVTGQGPSAHALAITNGNRILLFVNLSVHHFVLSVNSSSSQTVVYVDLVLPLLLEPSSYLYDWYV